MSLTVAPFIIRNPTNKKTRLATICTMPYRDPKLELMLRIVAPGKTPDQRTPNNHDKARPKIIKPHQKMPVLLPLDDSLISNPNKETTPAMSANRPAVQKLSLGTHGFSPVRTYTVTRVTFNPSRAHYKHRRPHSDFSLFAFGEDSFFVDLTYVFKPTFQKLACFFDIFSHSGAHIQTEITHSVDYDIPQWSEGNKTPRELNEFVDEAIAYVLEAPLYYLDVNGLTKY